jgi:hypothetical protein
VRLSSEQEKQRETLRPVPLGLGGPFVWDFAYRAWASAFLDFSKLRDDYDAGSETYGIDAFIE